MTTATDKNSSGTTLQVVANSYDMFNDLIGRSVTPYSGGIAGTTTTARFVYDLTGSGSAVLAFNGNESLTDRYLWGPAVDQILADERLTPSGSNWMPTTSGGTVYWALGDNEWSVRDWITYGTLVDHIIYDSFGAIYNQSNSSYGFIFLHNGVYRDAATGLEYHNEPRSGLPGRWYNPAIQRWMSEDPLGLGPDANPYRDEYNSPTNFTDPSGHDWLDNVDGFFAGFSDTVTCGLTTQARTAMYGDIATRNHQGGYFNAGQAVGAVDSALIGAAGFGAQGLNAGRALGVAREYAAVTTAYRGARAVKNLADGQGTATDIASLAFLGLICYGGLVDFPPEANGGEPPSGISEPVGSGEPPSLAEPPVNEPTAPNAEPPPGETPPGEPSAPDSTLSNQTLARTPAESVASNAAQGFENFQCDDCANAIEQALSESGQSGTRFTLDTGSAFGTGAEIVSTQAGIISTSGLHEATLVDNLIFDNHNPLGALPLNWFMDLISGKGGFIITIP
jgi:RHS repeat-associated protein